MNFNIGGPSNFSSSSSDNEEVQLLANPEENDLEQDAIIAQHDNIQRAIDEYLNQQNNPVTCRGSIRGHRVINRDRESANSCLFYDYFAENPRYNDQMFRRRFRMSRSLFLRIVEKVEARGNFFVQRKDSVGRLGLSALQKITAVFRMLAYGLPAEATDEYIKMRESTTIESLKRFFRVVVEEFKDEYLRSHNTTDVARLLRIGKDRGFPRMLGVAVVEEFKDEYLRSHNATNAGLLRIGKDRGFPRMLGSQDCVHWKWKNCPTAWVGQCTGRSGSPTIILEAVADYDPWIYHTYFGLPGTNKDIYVLEASHLFANLTQGIAPPAHYVIQEQEFNMGY